MKNGTAYAARLKKAYARIRSEVPTPQIPETDDPLRRLAVGILGVGCSSAVAEQAVERLVSSTVGWNDVRVSNADKIDEAMGGVIPDGRKHCQRLIDALQAIFDRENRLSLDGLKTMGVREAKQYLERLDGVDEYAVASVVLWALGGHGIPVNDRLFGALRDTDLIHPDADRAEVQAFLERHVSAADAKEFCLVMTSFSPSKHGASKRAKTTGDKAKKKTKTATQ